MATRMVPRPCDAHLLYPRACQCHGHQRPPASAKRVGVACLRGMTLAFAPGRSLELWSGAGCRPEVAAVAAGAAGPLLSPTPRIPARVSVLASCMPSCRGKLQPEKRHRPLRRPACNQPAGGGAPAATASLPRGCYTLAGATACMPAVRRSRYSGRPTAAGEVKPGSCCSCLSIGSVSRRN